MRPTLSDYVRAHRKVLLGLVSLVLLTFLDSTTVQWIVTVLGAGLLYAIPNDSEAVARIYRKA